MINTQGIINTRNLTTPLGVADPGSAVELELKDDFNTLTVQTVGTYTGALSLQVTLDGKTWITITAAVFQNIVTNVLAATIASGVLGIFQINIAGMQKVRITGLAAMTGAVTVNLNATKTISNINIGAAVPTSAVTLASTTVTSTTKAAPAATIAGSTVTRILSAASNNLTSLKGSQGRLLGIHLANNTAAWKYMKFYNKATAPVVASDVPIMTIGIPPNGVRDIEHDIPTTFALGIAYAIVNLIADTDATNVAVGDVSGYTLHV